MVEKLRTFLVRARFQKGSGPRRKCSTRLPGWALILPLGSREACSAPERHLLQPPKVARKAPGRSLFSASFLPSATHPSYLLQCTLPVHCNAPFLPSATSPSYSLRTTLPVALQLPIPVLNGCFCTILPILCNTPFLPSANHLSYPLQLTLPICCNKPFLPVAKRPSCWVQAICFCYFLRLPRRILPPRRPTQDTCCHALRDLQEGWVPVSVLPCAWTWRSNRGDSIMRHDVSARQAATEEERSFKKRRAHGEG